MRIRSLLSKWCFVLYYEGTLTFTYRKLDRAAEAAQRKEIKALLQTKKESTKRYEESLRRWSTSDDSTVVDDEDASDLTSGQLSIASAIQSTITVESLGTCMRHVLSLLQDIGTLQKTLSSDGEDPSEHQQTLVGSYFRARGHLDALLLGNPQTLSRLSANSIEAKTPDKIENELKIVKAQHKAQKKAAEEKRTKSIQDVEKDVQHQVAQAKAEDEKRRVELERITEMQKRTIEATLTRGERLESVRDESDALARQAQRFYKEAEMRRKEERDIVLPQHQNVNQSWDSRGEERHLMNNEPSVRRRNSISQRSPFLIVERAPEARQKMELEIAKRMYEEEMADRRMRYERDIARQKYEAEYARKKYEEEAMRKHYDKEHAKKKYNEEAAKKAADEAAAKKAAKQAKATAEAKVVSTKQQPILFKDAIGRKFTFPFHLCATWQGMHGLISQAFLHIDSMSTGVLEGQFDLLNSDGEIIMPTYWDSVIQPGWHITMQMWPLVNPAHSPVPLPIPQPVTTPLPLGIEIIHPKPEDTRMVQRPSVTSISLKPKAGRAAHKAHKPGHIKTTHGSKNSSLDKDKARTKSTKRNSSASKHGGGKSQYVDIEAEADIGAEGGIVLDFDNSSALQRPGAIQQLTPTRSTELMFNETVVDDIVGYSPASPKYSPASPKYSPTLSAQKKPQEGEWGNMDFQGHLSESFESLGFGSHKAYQNLGKSTLHDDHSTSPHISLTSQGQDEEEVNELLREWTTVFH
jgi:hypothetical protein